MKPKSQKGAKNNRPPAEQAFIGLPAKITKLLASESDRGTILILAAYLEEILGLVIRAACVSDDAAEALLKFRKPAGDFDSRILTAFAFGLIHSEDVLALRFIQRIRNRAAHFDRSGRGFDVLFDSDVTAEQVCGLAAAMNLGMRSKDHGAIRSGFIACARLLATRLLIHLASVRQNSEPSSSKQHANAARERLKGTEVGKMLEDAESHAREGDLEPLRQISQAITRTIAKKKESQDGA